MRVKKLAFDWSVVNLLGKRDDLLAVVEQTLVGMVRGAARCADLREVSRRLNLDQVLVVQSQDLLSNVLNPLIYEVKAVLPRIDVRDDSVVDINEGLFCFGHRDQHPVEHLGLVHFIRAHVDFRSFQLASLLAYLLPFTDSNVHRGDYSY